MGSKPCTTYKTDVLINCLYPPIRLWYKQFRVDEFLHSKHDAILHAKADGGSESICNEF